MVLNKNGYSFSSDRSRMQVERIHRFLSNEAYWCLGIPRAVVERAIQTSRCFGIFNSSDEQIGFARVVTDEATFAWICDVYIEKPHRGHGLAKWLMANVVEELAPLNLRRVCLTTKDAHGLYQQLGLQVTQTPEYWMERKDNEVYKRSSAR